MKLNHDCIRDVLLCLEDNLPLCRDDRDNLVWCSLSLGDLCALLPGYSEETVFYSIYNLDQAGFLDCTIQYAGGGVVYHCSVNRMTYSGHEFLDRIRDDKRWTAAKKILAAVRDYSLDAVSAVTQGMTSAAIDAHFRLSGTNPPL